jgi:hypothetical protein
MSHSSPLILIQEITALKDWDALAVMSLLVISCAEEKIITLFVHIA